jgi:nucleoside 2-deoxyribosyltransferase
MQIYFAASIRGGRDDLAIYQQIIRELQQYGTVLTEHIGATDLTAAGEKNLTDIQIFKRDRDWLQAADVVVAEVSQPSLGVGYEIGCAEFSGKKILCLFRPSATRRLSAMVAGNPKIINRCYVDFAEAKTILRDFFQV